MALFLLGVKQTTKAIVHEAGKKRRGTCADNESMPVDQFIRRGFDVKAGRLVKQSLQITDNEISNLIGITSRTMQRKLKTGGKFDMITSDRLYRVAYIMALATEVFENNDEARKWLHEPQYDLANRIPLVVIETEAGAREVENLLQRIEHGVMA